MMNSTCNLTNRSAGRVVYKIDDPDFMVRREIYPGQTLRNIKVQELEKLIQQPGGDVLFYQYLMIDDEDILKYLMNGGEVVPEYWLDEKQLPKWMRSCSLEEFKDALDYSQEGTKDLIKKYAADPINPLNDFAKRKAILDQLGFDVTKALEMTKEDKPQEEKKEDAATTGRRSTSTTIVKPKKAE